MIKPISPTEIKALSPDERQKKVHEVHHAVVIVHALLSATEMYVDFLKHYQFLIENKRFRKHINDTWLENKLLVRELDNLFAKHHTMKEHVQGQQDFSYLLLEKLEQLVKDFTAEEFGMRIEKREIE